jgi:L-lactate dehydrogenase complex protein LldG
MNSRERILERLEKNSPQNSPLPALPVPGSERTDPVEKFKAVLESIGGTVVQVTNWKEIKVYLNQSFSTGARWINRVQELNQVDNAIDSGVDPHQFENVSLTILKGHFGVAENGAVWVTDDNMGDRALPFICEHLAVVIHSKDIYPTLHEAYHHTDQSQYDFGTFIAGPSKTADIEQSLVLGAHGPKSMTLFLLHPDVHDIVF